VAVLYAIDAPNPTPTSTKICPLCGREIPPLLESRHHLIPKLKGGTHGPVAILHRACHCKIHAVFNEAELARSYNTIEQILSHPEMGKFAKWIAKRPPYFNDGTRSLRRSRKR
jgi:hypothetical protein